MLSYQRGSEHDGSVGKEGKGGKECMVNSSLSRGHDRLPEGKGKKVKVDRACGVSSYGLGDLSPNKRKSFMRLYVSQAAKPN